MTNINRKTFLKRVSVGAIVLLVAAGTSCKKYTDLQPLDALSTTTSFSNAANVDLALQGIYNAAAVGTYNGGPGRGYPFGGASIEQSEMRGEDMVNIAAFFAITYQNTYDATTANNVNMFINCYQLINQCNTFIDGVRAAGASGAISAATALSYEGEARFLRALAHHELVIMFCRPYLDGNGAATGLPYRTLAVNSQASVATAAAQPRGTVAQDYAGILADLDFAEKNITVLGGISRATAGGAVALKTRVKLHMGDWAGVIAEGAKLGTSGAGPTYTSPLGNSIGKFALTASPDGPFVSPAANAANSESIFSVAQSTTANGGVNGALPAMLGPADKGGRGLVCTSPNLYNAPFWVTSDKRRTLLQIQQLSPSTAKYYFNYKYRDYTTNTDWSPIIRYAEVLLNVGEAYARTGVLTNALGLLNAVRNRSVAAADQYTAASFTTNNAMTQAILNERRVEFAGEGRRWEDIHRLANDATFAVGGPGSGIPAKILIGQILGNGSQYDTALRPMISVAAAPPANPALPYTNFRFIWPIPATELAANPALTQNPNY